MRRLALLLVVLVLLCGCTPPVRIALNPPAWIQGAWLDDSGSAGFTFTATTVIQVLPGVSTDLGELYRALETPVTETGTGTLYEFTVAIDTGNQTMRFEKMDESTLNFSLITSIATIGPAPLYRQ